MKSKRFRSFTLSMLALSIFISSTLTYQKPIDVYADSITDDDLKGLIGCSDEEFTNVKACIPILQTEGYSDAAIAGILGNAWQESGWSPLQEGGFGLCDSYDSNFGNTNAHSTCAELASETGTCPVGGSHKYCSKMIHNVEGVMEAMATASFSNVNSYNDFVGENWDTISKYTLSGTQSSGWSATGASMRKSISITSLDSFKTSSDPVEASSCFALVFEVCAGSIIAFGGSFSNHTFTIDEWNTPYKSIISSKISGTCGDLAVHEMGSDGSDTRGYKASKVYEWITGGAYTPSEAVTDNTKQMATDLAASGFWSEEDLSAFCKLAELDIQSLYLDNATRDNLSQSDLANLANWEDNVNNNTREYGFIAILRIIVMWIGIIFTVYILLLYLAYWFDRLNSIIDLDVLSILTFGKLHVAFDEKEANFSLGKKQDRMTVSHKNMVFICITGLVFGTLLITGTFYKLVAGLVNTILRMIGGS